MQQRTFRACKTTPATIEHDCIREANSNRSSDPFISKNLEAPINPIWKLGIPPGSDRHNIRPLPQSLNGKLPLAPLLSPSLISNRKTPLTLALSLSLFSNRNLLLTPVKQSKTGPLTALYELSDDSRRQLRLAGVRRRKVGIRSPSLAAVFPIFLLKARPRCVDHLQPATLSKADKALRRKERSTFRIVLLLTIVVLEFHICERVVLVGRPRSASRAFRTPASKALGERSQKAGAIRARKGALLRHCFHPSYRRCIPIGRTHSENNAALCCVHTRATHDSV